MFERYTETARRAIFFARYEASQFASPYIETEHLLLGVLREDKALAHRLLTSYARTEELRQSITSRAKVGPRIATSVDLPLSHETKRALAYAAEECERLQQKHITPAHLLLGLMREEKCFAAQLIGERGVSLESVREEVRQSETPAPMARSVSIAALEGWLAECEAGGTWNIEERRAENSATYFALYAGTKLKERGDEESETPAERLERTQMRIESIVRQMERAIAEHEFQKARSLSDEERKAREEVRRICQQFNLDLPAPRVARLCIAMAGHVFFSELRQRCEALIMQGVPEVWLLDANLKRAYTVTRTHGLRELIGETLRIADPPLEMDLGKIFG